MIKSNTTNREEGLIQLCEDLCGLGETGITSDTALYSRFVGGLNRWNNKGASIAIMNNNGADFDDKGYDKLPTGRMPGTINRDYNIDGSYRMLKLKTVAPSYDGVTPVRATPIDTADKKWLAKNAASADSRFSTSHPVFDERADGFDLYPKFTAAQVSAGAFIDLEWFRGPRPWDTTSATDTYEPPFDLQFHEFPAVGASLEYCKLFKPDLYPKLVIDMYGNGSNIPGLQKEMKDWYSSKQPSNARIFFKRRVLR